MALRILLNLSRYILSSWLTKQNNKEQDRKATRPLPHILPTIPSTYRALSLVQGLPGKQASDAFPHSSWSFPPVQFPLGAGCGFCHLAPQSQLPKELFLNLGPGHGCLSAATFPSLGSRDLTPHLDTFPLQACPKAPAVVIGEKRPSR